MNHNLINFTETLNKDLDKGKDVVGILLDLQNAIDTVDHNLLLSDLDHYGIQSLTNEWFKIIYLKKIPTKCLLN